MSNCKKCNDFLLGALYDELNSKEKEWFQNHLKECETCRLQFKQHKALMQLMDMKEKNELPVQYWEGYWDRLLHKIEKIETKKSRSIKKEQWFKTFIPPLPAWSYKLGFAVGILIIGIFIGRNIFSPSLESIQDKRSYSKKYGNMASLDSRTNRFLEKSKILLLGIINYDPEIDERSSFNLDHNREISQYLVQEVHTLQKDLERTSQKKLGRLIADLELILLQIANLESEKEISQIEMIQSGVHQKSILMKITINEMEKNYDSKLDAKDQKSKTI